MKRILSLLLAAALCLALLPVQVLAENTEDPAETGITAPSEEEIVTPPAEDEEAAADLTFAQAFPDANFRTYVTGTVLRSSTDGKADADVITEAQWETIRGTTSVSVSSRGIASLQGIGYFTGASSLNCSYNQLTELDVSQNTALTTLRCNGNQLKTLDLSQNTALTELDCSDNQLSTLDLSQNTALASAYLYGQQLTATEPGVLGDDGNYTVDLKPLLSAGAELDRITLRGSGTYDPVTGTVSLSSVPYQLQYAYATKSPNGDELDVTVEVPHTHAMQEIPAKDATCTEQGTILHWECEICDRCFQDSEGTTQLDSWTAHPRALGHDCSDWETVTEATETENGLQRQSCSRCGAVFTQVVPAVGLTFEKAFPDANFRAYVTETVLYRFSDGKADADVITADQWKRIQEHRYISISWKRIASLQGIEFFSSLITLNCDNNQLTQLDVTQNSKLKDLNCYNNQLAVLDVSNNIDLDGLICSSNQLTMLDVSNNCLLTVLNCSENQLTTLDVSNSKTLEKLLCSANQITTLDVSRNEGLTYLNCGGNKLTSLDVSNNTALKILYCYSNQLTSLDVSQNPKLEQFHCSENQLKSLDISQNALLNEVVVSRQDVFPLLSIVEQGDGTYTFDLKALLGDAYDPAHVALTENDNDGVLDLDTGIVTYPYEEYRVCYQYDVGSCDGTWMEVRVYPAHKHEMYRVPVKAATCTTQGITVSHWECDLCNWHFLDQEGTQRVNWGDVHSDALGHDCTDWVTREEPTTESDGLRERSCNCCSLTFLQVTPAIGLTFEKAFPDVNFRAYVTDRVLENSTDSKDDSAAVSDAQWETIQSISYIDVRNSGIMSLEGIQYFSNLEYLYCGQNQLIELDISKNTMLADLYCGNNWLKTLDVSQNLALVSLRCYNNQLTDLDISKNTKLEEIDCDKNQLTALDVRDQPNLTLLSCSRNQIKVLDVSEIIYLETLQCYNNQIKELNVRNSSLLRTLNCSSNKLTELDCSNNPNLKEIYCLDNQLTKLNLGNNPRLKELRCWSNQLTDLDLSNNLSLKMLDCQSNQLTDLDLSDNLSLKMLNCQSNQLTQLDLSNNNKKLKEVYCGNQNAVTSVPSVLRDGAYVVDLKALLGEGTEFSRVRMQDGGALDQSTGLVSYARQPITIRYQFETRSGDVWMDVTAELLHDHDMTAIAAKAPGCTEQGSLAHWECSLCGRCFQDQGGAQQLSWEAAHPAALGHSFGEWTVLQPASSAENGLRQHSCLRCGETFTQVIPAVGLTFAQAFPDAAFRAYVTGELLGGGQDDDVISDEQWQTIQSQTELYLSGRGIASLQGIEFFGSVYWLQCSDNQLTELDVSHNTALQELYCGNNQLLKLDLSHNTALEHLACGENRLTNLDVRNNTKLKYLYCSKNKLTELDVSNNLLLKYLFCYSNQLTSLDLSKNLALEDLCCHYNPIAFLDVSKNTALTDLGAEGLQLASLDVSNNPRLTWINCSNNQITALDVSHNPELSTLWVTGNQLKDLDISANTKLTALRCGDNQLTKLDVGKHTALTELLCGGNTLTTLDVSHNPELKTLWCYRNQLTDLDVSQNQKLESFACDYNQLTKLVLGNNPKLETLRCFHNQLTELDVTYNPALTLLLCANNQLTALNLSNNPKLETLSCSSNQLTALDLTNNPALTALYCANNHLTALDLSKNTALTEVLCSPQKGTLAAAITANSDGTYRCDLRTALGETFDFSRITVADGTLNADGTVTYAIRPSRVLYQYATGLDGTAMEVSVPALVTEASYDDHSITLTLSEALPQLYLAAYDSRGQMAGLYTASVSGGKYIFQVHETVGDYQWKVFFPGSDMTPEATAYELWF